MKHLLITIAAVVLVGCGGPPEVDRALHKAAGAGNIEAVKQHLAAGADMNAKLEGGGTPLHYAAMFNNKVIVELLIAKYADVNAKDESGWTPLHYAAGEGHKEIVELLITKGARCECEE
jgi:ankyrin repeat protein